MITTPSFLLPRAAFAAALLLPGLASAQLVSIDFETASQFTDNFRSLGPNTVAVSQSSNGAGNDVLVHNISNGSATGSVLLYDTTPGDTTTGTQSVFSTATPLAVSFLFNANGASANSSIGVIFADSTNASNHLLALFNVNSAPTNDTFRFFRDGTVSPVSVSAGTQVGSTVSNGSSGVDLGGPLTAFTATLSVSGTTPTIDLTVGGHTVSQTFAAGDFNWADTTVMLRLFDTGTASLSTFLNVDDFTVAAIPEPSSFAALAGLGALGLVVSRRRRSA